MLKNLLAREQQGAYSKETIDILRLSRSQNVGPKTFFYLIKLFGSASEALANIEEFSVKGGRSRPIKAFSVQDAEKEIAKLEQEKSSLITYKDLRYSELLLQISDFPPIISYKGNIDLFREKTIAIVGARNSSINGRSFAKKIAKDLTSVGYVTVSGLARGIDTSVHEADVSRSIAVLAGGIDYVYPPENKKLYDKMSSEGLIIAELPIESKPLSQHFPQRNRIISGLSLATIVVEAGLKSGSLITANFALEQNREVFAVPGFPMDPRYMGSNKLIKDGAYLLESSKDVTDNINSVRKDKKSFEDSEKNSNAFKAYSNKEITDIKDSDRQIVINLLSSYPVTYESIAEETGFDLPVVYTICLELELAGRIIRHSGNKISLIY
jgi:DNA processing protein